MLYKSEIKNQKSKITRAGFSLIELLTVITIMCLLIAIGFRFVKRTEEGQRQMNCQSKLKTLGQALRMYRLDENGYPPFTRPAGPWPTSPDGPTGQKAVLRTAGIGLWGLYSMNYAYDSPVLRYVPNPKVLHCPDDVYDSTHSFYQDPANVNYYNPLYNSYQMYVFETGDYTYLPSRTTNTGDVDYGRQLSLRNPADNTVVTWCIYHRGLLTKGGKDQDLVLFLDGSVEMQDAPVNWRTKPKREQ